MKKMKAVVFAYSEMGVRCLSALLTLKDISIDLIVTHKDNPNEEIWFDSVYELARLNRISVITPDDPNDVVVISHIADLKPDLIFSFYYRLMLVDDIINIPELGAYNLHGSLLPKYRGRSPTNWMIVRGEREAGATLHKMVTKPDAGDILDQEKVEILPNDTWSIVYQRTCFAAENVILRSVPKLITGTAIFRENPIGNGSYYGGRSKKDGAINVMSSAQEIHNLIRAVAPPYPGAFIQHENNTLKILGSYYIGEPALSDNARLYVDAGSMFMDCNDGKRFEIRRLEINDSLCSVNDFLDHFGRVLVLTSPLT